MNRSDTSLPEHFFTRTPSQKQPSLPPRSAAAGPMLFVPQHYEPNYSYPLVVWLHDAGSDERQLTRVLPQFSLRNYVGVAPRGTERVLAGYTWPSREEDLSEVAEQIFAAIETASSRCNVAAERVFLAGYREGGSTALRMALAHPEKFAGVVSLQGRFPRGGSPLAHFEESRRLPVFVTRSEESELYPLADAQQDLQLYKLAGMNVTAKEYPREHELSARMLADANSFMMQFIVSC